MTLQFSRDEIQILLTSLEYSKRNITDAQNTPLDTRSNELRDLESIAVKLRAMRKIAEE